MYEVVVVDLGEGRVEEMTPQVYNGKVAEACHAVKGIFANPAAGNIQQPYWSSSDSRQKGDPSMSVSSRKQTLDPKTSFRRVPPPGLSTPTEIRSLPGISEGGDMSILLAEPLPEEALQSVVATPTTPRQLNEMDRGSATYSVRSMSKSSVKDSYRAMSASMGVGNPREGWLASRVHRRGKGRPRHMKPPKNSVSPSPTHQRNTSPDSIFGIPRAPRRAFGKKRNRMKPRKDKESYVDKVKKVIAIEGQKRDREDRLESERKAKAKAKALAKKRSIREREIRRKRRSSGKHTSSDDSGSESESGSRSDD